MQTEQRGYTVDAKRQEHPNAYRPWTEDEEHELVRLHREGGLGPRPCPRMLQSR